MKLQWKVRKDRLKATANTPYANMFIRQADDSVFAAFVSSHHYNATPCHANRDTLEAAQAWCEDAYAELLRAELVRLSARS